MIGWTPAELANHLLAETLEQFADKSPGLLEQLDEPQHFGVSELVPRSGGNGIPVFHKDSFFLGRTRLTCSRLDQYFNDACHN